MKYNSDRVKYEQSYNVKLKSVKTKSIIIYSLNTVSNKTVLLKEIHL